MTEPYVPIMANTYDISLELTGDSIVLSGLDQTEVMRFMSLMPKIYVKRYFGENIVPKWDMTTHKGSNDGNNE